MRNTDRPNVIICLCDQLRAFEVGCYGNEVIRTPNIDGLASRGVRFEVACSNNPVCTPARSILLSGQYGRTCLGGTGNAGEPEPVRSRMIDPTLPEVFRAAGYHTGLIGKWHLHVKPELLGFDTGLYPRFHHRYTGQTYMDLEGREFTPDGYGPDVELAELRDVIGGNHQKPFFLYYNISQPHMPVADAPEQYRRMYSRDTVPLRDNVAIDGRLPWDENWFKIYLWDFLYYDHHLPHTERLPDGFDIHDLTALYYGMTSWVDDQVGQLLRLLEENDLDENTIVVFASDHGDNLGSHHLFNKQALYEESIRIPLMFRWPKALAPRVVTTQVATLVDVMPTLLALCGMDTPVSAQGTDLLPVMRGGVESVGENAAFIETSEGQIGVRTLSHLYGMAVDGK